MPRRRRVSIHGAEPVVRQPVAGGPRAAAVREVVEQGRSREVDAHLELRHVDTLPVAGFLASFECCEYGYRGVQPCLVVVVGDAEADVLPSRNSGQAGEPGEGVNRRRVGDKFGPGPVAAHAGHLHIDDAGTVRAHGLVADSPAVQDADGVTVRATQMPSPGVAKRLQSIRLPLLSITS